MATLARITSSAGTCESAPASVWQIFLRLPLIPAWEVLCWIIADGLVVQFLTMAREGDGEQLFQGDLFLCLLRSMLPFGMSRRQFFRF